MTQALIVFGNQTADEIVSTAEEVGGDRFDAIQKFVFHEEIGSNPEFCNFVQSHSNLSYIIGMTDVRMKPRVQAFADEFNMTPVSIIHPTAYVAPSATIGNGVFVAPQAVISVNAFVEDHSIIHIHSSVGHDCKIDKFCAVLPGARISGNVTLGKSVMIGSGAFIFQGVKIGYRSQVDALTYVRHDVAEKQVVSCRYRGGSNKD
ncbi:hypothetical protein N9Z53_00375 [Mariniblastus sp.]|nr:hypothetical protein [Mariniblastus sp.]